MFCFVGNCLWHTLKISIIFSLDIKRKTSYFSRRENAFVRNSKLLIFSKCKSVVIAADWLSTASKSGQLPLEIETPTLRRQTNVLYDNAHLNHRSRATFLLVFLSSINYIF